VSESPSTVAFVLEEKLKEIAEDTIKLKVYPSDGKRQSEYHQEDSHEKTSLAVST
jgi:hypothetical protein